MKNVLSEWLGKTPVWAKIARTGPDGKRYDVDCYNLDVVVSVGNRIKSKNTQPFFNWCQQTLLGLRKDRDYGQPNIIRFDDGNVSLDVRIAPEEDTVYLSQTQIACLFDTTRQNVSLHIRNILEEGELTLSATHKEFLLVQMEGQREVSRKVDHYNLDMILSIGYRVKSKAAISFRRWTSSVLKECLLKGYAIDERRAVITPDNFVRLINRIDSIDEHYRDDMIFMVLSAKDALGKIPSINPDLLDVKMNYLDKGDMFWVALDGARVIGCVGYETIRPGEARVHRLYVKPELKRQGVGTALMQALEKHISEKGYTKISIHCGDEKYWESNLFYKARGFSEVQPGILERDLD